MHVISQKIYDNVSGMIYTENNSNREYLEFIAENFNNMTFHISNSIDKCMKNDPKVIDAEKLKADLANYAKKYPIKSCI